MQRTKLRKLIKCYQLKFFLINTTKFKLYIMIAHSYQNKIMIAQKNKAFYIMMMEVIVDRWSYAKIWYTQQH
jgi:hypothetical protein